LTLPPAESSGEEDISTQQNRAQASSRLSRAHRDRGRPQGHRCAARPWPQALVGLSKVVKPPFGRADKMTDDASGGPFPSLAPPERLRRRSDYLRAAKSGQSRQSRAFKLQMAMRDEKSLGAPRFGFTVTKKVAGAVGRNRIRRRLKEALRVSGALAARPGRDYVFVARRAALTEPFSNLVTQMADGLARLGRLDAIPRPQNPKNRPVAP
jgi:ribonuclease P protein component